MMSWTAALPASAVPDRAAVAIIGDLLSAVTTLLMTGNHA
jgi:hypothetical protein